MPLSITVGLILVFAGQDATVHPANRADELRESRVRALYATNILDDFPLPSDAGPVPSDSQIPSVDGGPIPADGTGETDDATRRRQAVDKLRSDTLDRMEKHLETKWGTTPFAKRLERSLATVPQTKEDAAIQTFRDTFNAVKDVLDSDGGRSQSVEQLTKLVGAFVTAADVLTSMSTTGIAKALLRSFASDLFDSLPVMLQGEELGDNGAEKEAQLSVFSQKLEELQNIE